MSIIYNPKMQNKQKMMNFQFTKAALLVIVNNTFAVSAWGPSRILTTFK